MATCASVQTRQLSRTVSSDGGAGRGLTRFSVHRSVHLPSDPGSQQFAHVVDIADLERVARKRENLTAQRPKGHGRPGCSSGLPANESRTLPAPPPPPSSFDKVWSVERNSTCAVCAKHATQASLSSMLQHERRGPVSALSVQAHERGGRRTHLPARSVIDFSPSTSMKSKSDLRQESGRSTPAATAWSAEGVGPTAGCRSARRRARSHHRCPPP